jgi:acyl-CoA thioesterase-2
MTDKHNQTRTDPWEGLTPAELTVELFKLLDVQPIGDNLFRGRRKPGGIGRVYGGQVVAQALVAASKTVAEDRLVHSLHSYFLRGGSEDHEIDFRVENDFDGGSFSNRRVIAMQQGEVILNLAASFSRCGRGHQHQTQMPIVVPPEELEPVSAIALRHKSETPMNMGNFFKRKSPIELRSVGNPFFALADDKAPRIVFWFRVASLLDAPQWMHRAVVAYASDIAMIGAAARPHLPFDILPASLDHNMWFHRDVRCDEWLLNVIDSPWAGEGRGLSHATIYDRQGNVVASAAQEGMMRDRAMRAP